MPRTFTALVAQTPQPEEFYDRVGDALGPEYSYERAEPRCDEAGRVRIEGGGDFDEELLTALESGGLAPVEWAVVMGAMDEAVGVRATVFDGDCRIDSFEGTWGLGGHDTEAYLERFHGLVVDAAGPYVRDGWRYNPSLSLAVEEPDATLAETEPEPPFEVTGEDDWLLLVSETKSPAQFKAWLPDALRDAGLVLAPPDELVDRDWVPDDATTIEYETADVHQVRAHVPVSTAIMNDDGLALSAGSEDAPVDVNWTVALYGRPEEQRVDAWVFLGDVRKYTFDNAYDSIRGQPGANGGDVATYLEQHYGLSISPTPNDREMTPSDAVTPDSTPPTNHPERFHEQVDGVTEDGGESKERTDSVESDESSGVWSRIREAFRGN